MGVRKVLRCGRFTWTIDFYYRASDGKNVRFRKTSGVQTKAGALAEELRLRMHIASHGESYDVPLAGLTLGEFVERHWDDWMLTQFKPSSRHT